MKAARPPLPGWLETLRQRLFATPVDIAVSFLCVYVVWRISLPLVDWLLVEANWRGTSREDCTSAGACWVFIRARFAQFMYGQYPVPERWRVDLLGALAVCVAAALSWRRLPQRREAAITALVVLPPLGRRSRLPMIRFASIVFIEFWRGVPIITVIFLASLLLPLIMPTGFNVDRLARAVIGLAFVIAAYMAEAVRGGLQALPDGQAEAAQALGLGYWRITRLIVLPQALRIALPAMTNEFIALFKNTTLVLIVSIFDLLGIAQAALADPAWVGMNMEAYVFAGAIYWFACFGLSQWSR